MKILVISRNPWDEANAVGNTVSNFFRGIEGLEFAHIYFRSGSPDNPLCTRYYRVTEGEVLKKWCCRKKIGAGFRWEKTPAPRQQTEKERKEKYLVRMIQKHKLKVAYKLSDRLWYSEKWINGNLRAFVAAFSPDLVFTFVKSAPQYYLTVRFLREEFGIPVFSWIADDEYTGLARKKSCREIENLRYILRESAVVRGCSRELCDYYNGIFGCEASPLYKSCDLSTPVKEVVNYPLRLVYAGNLLYGRLEILKRIAATLEELRAVGKQAALDIYSGTPLSARDRLYFDGTACTRFLGRRDYGLIKKELAAADVVLHVESFEPEQLLKTKYSFSTKIIDALQSGNVLLAVGPAEQASMGYIRRIPGTCVIQNVNRIGEDLAFFLADAPSLRSRAQAIRAFAAEHHDSRANAEALGTLLRQIKEGAV